MVYGAFCAQYVVGMAGVASAVQPGLGTLRAAECSDSSRSSYSPAPGMYWMIAELAVFVAMLLRSPCLPCHLGQCDGRLVP